ncbi:MAG: exonuclease SbcCD subunit D [Opitutales bacterium]
MKFLHTADWQLGKPFARIRDDQKRARVRHARLAAIHRLGAVARETGAECILVAGDLFDSPSADKATVSAACSAIGQLGLPVYAIPGNHDHGGPGSVWTQPFFLREQAALAPNLHVLLTPAPVEIEGAVLLPCPLVRRSAVSDPTAWLRAPAVFAGLPADRPRLVLAHGSTQAFSSPWEDDEEEGAAGNLLDLSRLPGDEIDYLALGDWHGTREVTPKAWFAGTPELDRFPKGGDHDPGNVLLVEVARGQPPVVTRHSTAELRWNELAFDFAADDALAEFQSRLSALLGQRAHEDLLRLHLTGSLGIAAATRLDELLESLEARLLRLKLSNQTRVAPSEAEIAALTERAADPLIARVARALVEQAAGDDEEALTARVALRELHATCEEEVAS